MTACGDCPLPPQGPEDCGHDAVHPVDCLFCAAGEPMRHNYEPPPA